MAVLFIVCCNGQIFLFGSMLLIVKGVCAYARKGGKYKKGGFWGGVVGGEGLG